MIFALTWTLGGAVVALFFGYLVRRNDRATAQAERKRYERELWALRLEELNRKRSPLQRWRD